MQEVAAETVALVSQASSFEPIAGTGLAITLAYLNLQRFRYRKKIRETAQEFLADLQSRDGYRNVKHTTQCDLIEDLAGILDHDATGEVNGDSKEPKNQNKSRSEKVEATFWKSVFDVVFKRHLDRYITQVLASVALLVLFLGVADTVGLFPNICERLFGPDAMLKFWYWVLVAATLVPIALIATGNHVVKKLKNKAKAAAAEINRVMEGYAQDASLPDLPEPSSDK